MSIFIGQNELKEIYIGNKQILQVYKGSELLWELESGGGDEPIPTPTTYKVSVNIIGNIYDETYQVTYYDADNTEVRRSGLDSNIEIEVYPGSSVELAVDNDSVYVSSSDYDVYSNITQDTQLELNYIPADREPVTTTVSCAWKQTESDSQFTGDVEVEIRYYNPIDGSQEDIQYFSARTEPEPEIMDIDLHMHDVIEEITYTAKRGADTDQGEHSISWDVTGIESNVVTGNVAINIIVRD